MCHKYEDSGDQRWSWSTATGLGTPLLPTFARSSCPCLTNRFALGRTLPGLMKCSLPISQAYIVDVSQGTTQRSRNLVRGSDQLDQLILPSSSCCPLICCNCTQRRRGTCVRTGVHACMSYRSRAPPKIFPSTSFPTPLCLAPA